MSLSSGQFAEATHLPVREPAPPGTPNADVMQGGNQPAMLYTGRQLKEDVGPHPDELDWHVGDDDDHDAEKEMWETKLAEANRWGISSSIKHHGVLNPVLVTDDSSGRYLYDGHHRVAVSAENHPGRHIPVEFVSQFGDPR